MSGPAVAVAAALAVAPMQPIHASMLAIGPTDASAPTAAQLREFDERSATANEAAEAGEWDTTLVAAETALETLPEHDSTLGRRADLMMLVGSFAVDDRNEAQIEQSAAILRGYVADLREAALPRKSSVS